MFRSWYSKSEALNLSVQTVLGEQLLSDFDILALCYLLGFSLALVPGLPLGLGLEAEHAGLLSGVVANAGLLEPSVESQKFVIAQTLASFLEGSLDNSGSSLELFFAHHHRIIIK
jgi:hypothetical protein